eukprot:jgi/Botrbrau1/16616/Bobra.0068s0042.1
MRSELCDCGGPTGPPLVGPSQPGSHTPPIGQSQPESQALAFGRSQRDSAGDMDRGSALYTDRFKTLALQLVPTKRLATPGNPRGLHFHKRRLYPTIEPLIKATPCPQRTWCRD